MQRDDAPDGVMLRLGALCCRERDLVTMLARWDLTPLECHVAVRLLMLWAPADIARERGRSLSHIRNTIQRVVRKSGSTAGVPGLLARAAELLPAPADPNGEARIDVIASEVQARRR